MYPKLHIKWVSKPLILLREMVSDHQRSNKEHNFFMKQGEIHIAAVSQNIALIPRGNKEHLSLPLFCPDFELLLAWSYMV